jgi:hypothetical protein
LNGVDIVFFRMAVQKVYPITDKKQPELAGQIAFPNPRKHTNTWAR